MVRFDLTSVRSTTGNFFPIKNILAPPLALVNQYVLCRAKIFSSEGVMWYNRI